MPELLVERRLDAVSERVFELWTNGDAWARWFLPQEGAEWIEMPVVDPRPGGRIAIALPSRDMVLRLATTLDLPLRQHNGLLVAAGFAPVWRETDLAARSLPPSATRSTA